MNLISQFLTWYGGVVLFLAVLAEQGGIPIPAAPLLLVSGALAANGQLNLVSAIAWTTAACMLADAIWFYAGHRGKARILRLLERCHGGWRTNPRTTGVRAMLRGLRDTHHRQIPSVCHAGAFAGRDAGHQTAAVPARGFSLLIDLCEHLSSFGIFLPSSVEPD